MYTLVAYLRKNNRNTYVLYVGGSVFSFVSSRLIDGRVRKRWKVGKTTEGVSMRVRALDVASVLLRDAEACTKMHILDVVFRDAAREGLKVHPNDYFVELWLSKPLGEAVDSEVDFGRLGPCIRCFTNSYGRYSIVSPPWCCVC